MAQLTRLPGNRILLSDLKVADSHALRAKGLIGQKTLGQNEGLWIPKCNWIHTFFMTMPIDVIYLDKNLIVTKLQRGLQPWRLPAPVWKARSVVEVASGSIDRLELKLGEQLYVGH